MSEELPDVMTGLEEYYGWLEKAKKVWEITRPIIRALSSVDHGRDNIRICKDKMLLSSNRAYILTIGSDAIPHDYNADQIGLKWLSTMFEIGLPTILECKDEILTLLQEDVAWRQRGLDNLKLISREYNNVLVAELLRRNIEKEKKT